MPGRTDDAADRDSRQERCPACGLRQRIDAEHCARCRELFKRLCECRADVSVFDDECGACGTLLEHPRWSPWPSRASVLRVLKIGLAATLLLGVPTAVFLHRYSKTARTDRWRVGAALDEAAGEGEWQTARVLARQLVDQDPRNAAGWFMLAFTGRKLGMHPQLLIDEARQAVRYQPDHGPARYFLALELAALGEDEEAREHVAEALEWSGAPDGIWRLAGELELARTRPDAGRALELFDEGYARGVRDPVLVVRAALVRMRQVGVIVPERYPYELTIALQRARSALALLGRSADAGLAHWLDAELSFAEGQRHDANFAAREGLDALLPGEELTLAARLHLVIGRVAFADGEATR